MSRKLERQIARAQAKKPMTPTEEIVQLEALGFRTVVDIQVLQQRLQQIAARIAELKGHPVPPPPPPPAAPPGK